MCKDVLDGILGLGLRFCRKVMELFVKASSQFSIKVALVKKVGLIFNYVGP